MRLPTAYLFENLYKELLILNAFGKEGIFKAPW